VAAPARGWLLAATGGAGLLVLLTGAWALLSLKK
jgi:hypothetical protein